VTIGGFAVVYLLLFVYLVSLFVGSQHRTVYDRLAGSRVLRGS
jgi:Na+/H+ antiporter NhaC